MAVKRQSPAVRQKEAEAKVVKCQSPAVRQEAETKAVKRQSETETKGRKKAKGCSIKGTVVHKDIVYVVLVIYSMAFSIGNELQ